MQVLRIRQHGVRLGVVEVVVPDVEQTHQHRQVLGEVRGAEVFVHGVEARQDALPVFRPDRDDIGQADCRVDRVAAADPVPEPEGVLRIDAELGNLLEVGRYGHEMPADGLGPGLVRVVDDATGRIMHLRFGETESAFDYMLATREYVEKHGKPLAFYSDKHGIFRVNHAAGSKSGTQFGRVLHDIGVELICANSPQAKGRVERANKTLQDRLIKEMRLNKISSIEEANAWLETFIVNFNQRFAKTPKYPKNLHRPVAETIVDLDDIFSWQETRKLSKSLTFRYDKMIYLVEPTEENTRIAGENIKVFDYPDGTLAFKYGHHALSYQVFDKLDCIDQGQIVDNKRLGAVLRLAQDKMDELDRNGKRERSTKMPKRRAQARIQEQLRAINPVLVNPKEFRASLKR